jgi:hypothetical protein
LKKKKYPMTSSGFEPMTFQLVSPSTNYATHVPDNSTKLNTSALLTKNFQNSEIYMHHLVPIVQVMSILNFVRAVTQALI